MTDKQKPDPRRPLQLVVEGLRIKAERKDIDDADVTRRLPLPLKPYFRLYCTLQSKNSFGGITEYVAFLDQLLALITVPPSRSELNNAPSLTRWCAIKESGTPALLGIISGHPIVRHGARARTSFLFQVEPDLGWARTWSRYYRLEEYDARFLSELQNDGATSRSVRLLNIDG